MSTLSVLALAALILLSPFLFDLLAALMHTLP